jgi:hypothetical protein
LGQQIEELTKRCEIIQAELETGEMNRQDLLNLQQWLKKVRKYAKKLGKLSFRRPTKFQILQQ